MGIVYWKADDGVKQLVTDVINSWHPDLSDAKVNVGVLMAYTNKEGESAVKHSGYPALATVKIVSLKDRVSKGYDAEMLIDAESWKSFSDKHKMALLDHELSHLEVKRAKVKDKDKDDGDDEEDVLKDDGADASSPKPVPVGQVILDDVGRPVLRTKRGDYNAGDGFLTVAARHGQFSMEVLNHRQVHAVVRKFVEEDEQ